MSSESVCNLSYLTGNFYECSPAFVQNSEIILFAAGSIVNAVSSTTGNVVGVFREHHSLITAISVVEGNNDVTIYSASVDGMIYAWNLNTLQVKCSFNVGVPVYDLASIINTPGETEKLVVVSSVAKASAEKKRKFAVLNFDVASQKVTTKLASLQFPRRCTTVLKIPLARVLEATGQVLSMEALYQQDQAAIETVLVVASSRKISFIPLSSQNNSSGGKPKSAPGVVHFVPDVDSRRGAITCAAASSHGDGVLVTGFEKGSIVVWHNIVQYYLSALAQTLTSTPVAVEAGSLSKKEGKKRNKKLKALLAAESTVAMPISTTLHWHAHSVHTVSLTTDGSTLYSGGAEGVLVVWHNINTTSSTGATKSFFPRLGCPISFLANNSSAGLLAGINVAVTTTDNAVHVINTATMREDWTARSLCITSRRESVPRRRAIKMEGADPTDAPLEPQNNEEEEEDEHQYLGINRAALSRSQAHTLPFIQSDYHWRCNLTVEPRSQWLVCNGYPGQLQAFDRNTQALAHAYSVVDYTRVSKKEANSKMFVPSISHSQFLKHPLGWFLGTVDVRKGSELEAECSLKFFEWSDVQSKYRLGAQMDNPHGPHRVTSLAFAGASSSTEDNNNSVSPVLAATASVDGTVKVWRAERNDITAPPTLSTSAKQRHQQQQQQLTLTNTTANSGNNSGETEAALPLKWVCAYSFRYRDSPATSVSFSRDGTLLAVAHRNLLSLWDPATVTMKASIVCPTSTSTTTTANASISTSTSNSILYTAFIEPKAASSLGGGCGSAYLFVGTQTSLSVYDLLTLQLVWTLAGDKYTAFAVASGESQLPSSHLDAWIAVSLTTTTSSTSTNGSGKSSNAGGNETDTEVSVDGTKHGQQQHKVLLFSPYSSTPLATHTLPAKASSLAFCPTNTTTTTNSDSTDGEGSGRGIAVATESCEMLFLTVGNNNNNGTVVNKAGKVKQLAAKVGEQAAMVYKVSVPALASTQQSEVVMGLNGSSNSKNGRNGGVQGVPLPTTRPGWLKDYFDEHSENIPSLGAISSGFFRNFHSTAANPTNTTTGTAAGSSNSASATSSKASRKRSAQQMSSSAITPAAVAVPQALWDEALSGVFVSPSNAATTTISSAAVKAAATPKKTVAHVNMTEAVEVVSAKTPSKRTAAAAAPLPAVTPKKTAPAAVSVETESTPAAAPVSATKAKKTPKKAAQAAAEVIVEEVAPVAEAAVEEAMEVTTEEPPIKAVRGAKKTSKIPSVVIASSLQTINEDEEMVVEEPAATECIPEDGVEEQEDTANKRRKTTRSNSVSSLASTASVSAPAEASTPTATSKATRVAASKIPARAPRVAASPSMTNTTSAIAPVVPAVSVPVVEAPAKAASKLKAPTEVKLTKRTLPAATAVAKAGEGDESDSSVSGLRRSTRARSNSNLSEDSAVSTGSATRKSARTSAR